MTICTPLGGRHRRPRRDGRHRHERRAAPARARLPGPPGDPRALRVRRGHQVAHPAHAHDVRRGEAYWTERDWATDAPDQDLQPRRHPQAAVHASTPGRTVIGGVAWAQRRGIGKVEVRIDDGEWQQAELGPKVTVDYWRQWYLPWDAAVRPPRHRRPGHHRGRRGAGRRPRRRPSPTAPPAASTSGRRRSSRALNSETFRRGISARDNLDPIRSARGTEPLREDSTHPPVGAPDERHDHEAHHPAPLGRPRRAGL